MRVDAPRILMHMGFLIDRDFVAINGTRDGCDIKWLAETKQPTDAEIDAAASSAVAAYAQEAQDKSTLDGMRDQVKQAISMLNTIQGAASFTNAQRDAAIKELAQIVERFIRVVMEQAR